VANNDDTHDDNNEVGYRKPPRRTQFVKGQSGNPKGSARASGDLDIKGLAQVVDQKTNRTCPECGSIEVSRSRLRGVLEHYVLRALQIHPYRCMTCEHRFVLKGPPPKDSVKQVA
jgi:DNA-directed RNA polymerase subunit RPC12/RpoP